MDRLDDILKRHFPPSLEEYDLSYEDFVRFFWKYKGLLVNECRNDAFWKATNENLSYAYAKLDKQDKELDKIYTIIQQDLQVAEQIQSALLPKQTERMIEELDIAIFHKQLNQIGGDYYDFFRTKSDNYAIGLFDIAGHGISASLIMSYLKAQMMSALEIFESPKEIIDRINSQSLDFLRNTKKYATVNLVHFENEKIRYVCGGGNGLLIHDKKKISFNKRDNFLGLRDREFHEYELPFSKGDLLVLYTDGISEAQNEKGEDFSKARLSSLVENNINSSVQEIVNICINELFSNNFRENDDITLIIMRKE